MRKQYHFWPNEHGFDAWDVDRLIRLSKDLPVREVRLETVAEIDSVYWFQGREEPTVRKIVEHVRLMGDVDLSYPVILGVDGRVMDGMHRIARSLLEHRLTVPAVRFEVQPEPDFANCQPEDLPYDSYRSPPAASTTQRSSTPPECRPLDERVVSSRATVWICDVDLIEPGHLPAFQPRDQPDWNPRRTPRYEHTYRCHDSVR